MEMPRPGAEHTRLSRLAGDWVGEERISPSPFDPKGGSAIGHMRARMGLDGFYLIMDYEQERDRKITFRGHAVFGCEEGGGCAMHWFDSAGMPNRGPARGLWDGDTLRLTLETDGMHSRYLYVLGEGGYRMRIETSTDGHTWAPFLDGRYRKR